MRHYLRIFEEPVNRLSRLALREEDYYYK